MSQVMHVSKNMTSVALSAMCCPSNLLLCLDRKCWLTCGGRAAVDPRQFSLSDSTVFSYIAVFTHNMFIVDYVTLTV